MYSINGEYRITFYGCFFLQTYILHVYTTYSIIKYTHTHTQADQIYFIVILFSNYNFINKNHMKNLPNITLIKIVYYFRYYS